MLLLLNAHGRSLTPSLESITIDNSDASGEFGRRSGSERVLKGLQRKRCHINNGNGTNNIDKRTKGQRRAAKSRKSKARKKPSRNHRRRRRRCRLLNAITNSFFIHSLLIRTEFISFRRARLCVSSGFGRRRQRRAESESIPSFGGQGEFAVRRVRGRADEKGCAAQSRETSSS